jgi:hypothetical protein
MGAPKKDEVRVARGYRTTPTVLAEILESADKQELTESRWIETAAIEKLDREKKGRRRN